MDIGLRLLTVADVFTIDLVNFGILGVGSVCLFHLSELDKMAAPSDAKFTLEELTAVLEQIKSNKPGPTADTVDIIGGDEILQKPAAYTRLDVCLDFVIARFKK